MKKRRKSVTVKRAAGKRKASRKATRPAQTRSAWQQKLDADDIRRAIEDGMQDLRMKKP